MKALGTITLSDSGQPMPQLFIRCGTWKEWLSQRAQVKTGTADEHRHMIARFRFLNRLNRGARPISSRERLSGRDEVDEMMGHAATLGHRDLGGRYFHLLIYLNGI